MIYLYRDNGQAIVEYLLILTFVVLISLKTITLFRDFFKTSMGSFGHILTMHLTTGVCKTDCFFPGYKNGREN